ncbi:DJ-1/PfpI family protein [Methylococcus mesophilus]|uniref:DJ-1/PfpI family protein n=1 Tax=Methylococcus mesophilus TaxID=2993564 RepID=UPI00224B2D36|nr:DJ-1/PfpI family protein [Methylococcus mesophilus]UZR28877.1 DJ-1/PfpI family protein [Methylococcus mesophilus]
MNNFIKILALTLFPAISWALTHEELMTLKPNPNVNANGIGIYVYDGMNALDAIGPYQVFKSAGLKTFLIAKNKDQPIVSSDNPSTGLKIVADKSWSEVQQLDVLVVPGGFGGTVMQTMDPEVLNWIKAMDQKTIYTTSVCTGAWILGAAGVLEGKKATTNWYRAKDFLAKYGAKFVSQRYVQDGKYITSAGVTAGADMALYLVNKLFGVKDYTQAVMLDLEYDPKPPVKGGSIKKSKPDVVDAMREMYDWAFDMMYPGYRPQ